LVLISQRRDDPGEVLVHPVDASIDDRDRLRDGVLDGSGQRREHSIRSI
jgi:hypothetical protein